MTQDSLACGPVGDGVHETNCPPCIRAFWYSESGQLHCGRRRRAASTRIWLRDKNNVAKDAAKGSREESPAAHEPGRAGENVLE